MGEADEGRKDNLKKMHPLPYNVTVITMGTGVYDLVFGILSSLFLFLNYIGFRLFSASLLSSDV